MDARIRIAIALACFVTPAGAVTRDVPATYPTIAAGLAASASGDTVLVACGSYAEHDLSMKSGVTLRSESGDPSCVSIDAGDLGRVMSGSNLDPATRIEGITMTGGRASGAWPASAGGAAYFLRSSPSIRDCAFVSNH